MSEQIGCYNSGWQDGFKNALELVVGAIDRNYDEAEREGDYEYIDEKMAGWSDVKNIVEEIKESYLGKE